MPWENGRKRRHSDVLQDPYKGPQEFMEAGVRGFLINSVPDREEHSLDEAVKCLRKACVKLYGGIRPLKKEDASFAKGYVMIDFMEPDDVVPLPHPDADKFAAEEKVKAEAEQAAKEAAKGNEEMEEENKEKVEVEEATEDQAKTETVETEETKAVETKEEKTKEEEGDETKTKEEKDKEEQKKKEDLKKKKKEEEEKAKPPLMLAPHKFKSFRTELRNIMFIKSDVVDPVAVINAAFDLIMEKKPLFTDSINRILPVQGVCDNDYKQLEIMCRRVLAPYVGEHLEREEPPSFGVMLIDKMCEPGAEVLLEVVRSVIWCLNPMAWQSSPWCEPDVTIHLEIIGSKIILSAMPQYMKYRQYSPFALHELGHGKPEDEDKLARERKDDDDREKDKGKDRDRGRKKKDSNKKRDDKKKEDKEKKKDDVEKKDEGEKKTDDTTEEASKKPEEEKTEEVKEEEKEKESTEVPDEKKSTTEVKRSSRSKGDKKSTKS